MMRFPLRSPKKLSKKPSGVENKAVYWPVVSEDRGQKTERKNAS
jgi:hypothetical protein